MSCTPRAMVTAAVRRAVEGALWMSCTPRTMVTVAVRGGRAAPPGLWSPLLCGEPLCAVGVRHPPGYGHRCCARWARGGRAGSPPVLQSS